MDCIFCEIIKGNIPAKIIGENEHAIAFLDVNPVSDGHTIVIPKKHYKNFSECPQDILIEVIKLMHLVANKIKDSKLKP
jgi:histidine triad (HIT) family protein